MSEQLQGILEVCPRCGASWKTAIAMSGAESEFWLECSGPSCNTWYYTYKPQPHQEAFHRDYHRFTGNFGGYGTGKTLCSRAEIQKHIFITPAGNTLIGANVSSQYEQTIKRELESDVPAAFIANINTQKSYYDFINGHRLLYRPYDDPDKLRSYNLTQFLIMEGSEVNPESFTQLKTRLRNTASSIPKRDNEGNIIYKEDGSAPILEHDWRKGLIESNPDDSWIKSDILLASDAIYTHGDVKDKYVVDEDRRDDLISSHITSTSANKYLPEDFLEQISKNRPPWWVNRYVYGSFINAEGKVYPGIDDIVIDDYEIPKHWKRVMAHDYGLSDPSIFLYGAIDPIVGELIIYKGVDTVDKNVEELANICKKHSSDIPQGGWAKTPLMDPKSGWKRDYNKRTLADLYLDYGLVFEPGHINVDARIFRLNTYIQSGKLKIMKSCKVLIEELKEYKFKKDDDTYSGYSNVPVDKKNHSINALEWITMSLPADPKNLELGIYDDKGNNLMQATEDKKDYSFHALSDEDEYNDTETVFGIRY